MFRHKKPTQHDLAVAALERAALRLERLAKAVESSQVRTVNVYEAADPQATAREIERLQRTQGAM